jgi:hypothetical protein
VAQQTKPVIADSSVATQSQAPANAKQSLSSPRYSDKSSDKSKDEGNDANPTAPVGTSNDRLFFALPNFLTLENVGRVPPLTSRQKFGVVSRNSFDYVIYPWYGFLAGIAQAEDSEPGFGQGAEGYAKRFGANFADGTIEIFMTGAVLPSVLHQDPRYFQLGHGTIWTAYSMSRNLITRSDSGNSQFNYSEVIGGALSASISTYTYHPKGQFVTTNTAGGLRYIPSDRTLTNTAKVWGTQYAYDTLALVVKEFWPDIRRAIRHKKNTDVPGITAP